MRDIVSNILTWSCLSEPHGYNFNSHLVRHPGGNICIDPVEPTDDDMKILVDEGVEWIVLTNRNHSRTANQVRASTGARTIIHAEDADHARSQETELDDVLENGVPVGPFEVIDASGKSPGEIALLWRSRRILIVGDAIIGNPPEQCRLLPGRVMDDPTRLRSSEWNIFKLDFYTLVVGDGVSILKDPKSG